MSRPARRARTVLIAAVAVSLAGCGGNGSSPDVSAGVDSVPPTTGAATTTVPGPVKISVTVGTDSSAAREERVALGTSVEVTLVNPDGHDDFHLHGYDIATGRVEAGEPATIAFTADVAGSFVIESHESGEVLVNVVVE